MQKSALLAAIQKEIHRHDLSYFVDEPPSVAQGGRGIVEPGCSARRKGFNTVSEFAEHLANDEMPGCAESVSVSRMRRMASYEAG